MSVERRDLFRILGAGLATTQAGVGQHQHGAGIVATASNEYAPRALSESEYAIVDRLADLILPPDEISPGAHDAGVARYVDIVLLYGDKGTLAEWKSGVQAVEAAAKEAHSSGFWDLTRMQQTAILEAIAKNEANPNTPAETLFVALKRLAIEAFYLSSAGHKNLGYKGGLAVASFPGCTHPEHQS